VIDHKKWEAPFPQGGCARGGMIFSINACPTQVGSAEKLNPKELEFIILDLLFPVYPA
jgi:hypothetical protein